MNIKTKYNLGDRVIINGQRYRVHRMKCNIETLPTGEADVMIVVYGQKKIAAGNHREITLGDAAIEQNVEADPVKD